MIPAHGVVAVYERSGDHQCLPVVAWDDDGTPLVLDPDGLGLVDATGVKNGRFVALEDEAVPLGVLPGGGWIATIPNHDGPRVEPVVGWLVYQDGSIDPLVVDIQGMVTRITSGDATLDHPDRGGNSSKRCDPPTSSGRISWTSTQTPTQTRRGY
jgi:hypothetical protein